MNNSDSDGPHWNYRVVKMKRGSGPLDPHWYYIAVAHYAFGKIIQITDTEMPCGTSLERVKKFYEEVAEAFKLPVLDHDELKKGWEREL